MTADVLRALASRWQRASQPRLILDYDGTLVPLAPRPQDAAPDREILDVLGTLARMPDVRLLLASGRDRATLDRWFGHLPVDLIAEHGFFLRIPGRGWSEALPYREGWASSAEGLLREFDVLHGHSVLEARRLGATKGSAAIGWIAANSGDLLLAIGDDTTDEELFRGLPEHAVTIRVGEGETEARWRIPGPGEVRGLLRSFDRRAAESPAGSPGTG